MRWVNPEAIAGVERCLRCIGRWQTGCATKLCYGGSRQIGSWNCVHCESNKVVLGPRRLKFDSILFPEAPFANRVITQYWAVYGGDRSSYGGFPSPKVGCFDFSPFQHRPLSSILYHCYIATSIPWLAFKAEMI